MKVLSGRRRHELDPEGFAERIRGRFPVHVDVGTGSGRLVQRYAEKNPGGFYIGMDPSAESMYENSLKAAKRGKRAALGNLLFIIASIEVLPDGLEGIADTVTVMLPWGSLRDGIVKAGPQVLENLRKLGKPGAALEMLVGYDERIEPCEMHKRSLPALSSEYLVGLTPAYRNAGIELRRVEAVSTSELKQIESDWAKKLAYGGPRTMYRLHCVYI